MIAQRNDFSTGVDIHQGLTQKWGMAFESAQYPRDLASVLLTEIEGTTKGLDPSVAPIPTHREIEALLDVTFLASLLEEEGRRTQFRLAFVGSQGAVNSQLAVFTFRQPVPLTARAIAKLAPAVDPGNSYLGIEADSDGQLRAWGIIHRGLDREHLSPYFLTIATFKTGAFIVEFLARPKLLYSQGQARVHQGVPKNLTDVLRDGARFTGRLAHEFERITTRMLEHGHGGTILIIDEGRKPSSVDLHPSYTHHGESCDILKNAAEADEKAKSGDASRGEMTEGRFAIWREEQRRRHDEAIDFVAQLTAVDGATIITDSLRLVGFGATIRTGDASDNVTIATGDPLDAGLLKPASLSDFPGNRHRSAILFCDSQPTGLALAIVASRDGDVSLFGRTGGATNVIAFRPFGWGRGLRGR